MKIVNKSNIPDSLFRYLKTDNYDYDVKGRSYSATEILNPTQIILLSRRYDSLMEADAIDRLWVMLGNGVHAILEDEKGIEKIERLKTMIGDMELSGKWDRIFNNTITDYKVTSAISVMYGSKTKDWTLQLSIYRWLYLLNKGILLNDTGFIVALLRDWSDKNLTNPRYPKQPAVEIPLKLLSPEDTQAYVVKRFDEIKKAESLSDDKLPECTDSERWWNPTQKKYLRCAKYCSAATFCKQLERERKNEQIEFAETA